MAKNDLILEKGQMNMLVGVNFPQLFCVLLCSKISFNSFNDFLKSKE